MTQSIEISGRQIGPGLPVYVIAEMSANHGGDLGRARAIVEAAADAGADAIKLQTYTADTITLDSDGEHFRVGEGTPWAGRRLYELYAEASTPWDWQPELVRLANARGIDCFSSPFDASAVDFLEKLDVPAYKIASFELVDHALIERCARTGKPLIMSTGMATGEEIAAALDAARAAGAAQIALLKCTSAYPSPVEELNLRAIRALAERFDVPVGLSDHTLDESVVVSAVALGACIVERHLTMRRADGGPDASFSLEPEELRSMVGAIRSAETMLGAGEIGPCGAEAESARFRRSLFFVRDIAAGATIEREDVRSLRPAAGLAPKHLEAVIGRRAVCAITRGTPLAWDLVD